MKKKLLISFLILLGTISNMQALTVLQKGDIAIVGLSSTNTIDEFTWIALTNIDSGTVIYFSDAGYNRSLNQFMGTTTTAGAQDGLYRFTAQSNITAGQTFTLNTSTSYTTPSPWIPITGTTFGNDTTLTLSNTGDQVMAFQSTNDPTTGTSFTTTNITMLYQATIATLNFAAYVDTVLVNLNSEKMSNLHPQLDHDIIGGTPDCFIQAGLGTGPIDESDNAVYRGTISGTKNDLLTAMSSLANWKRYDPATPDGSSYLTAPTTTGWTNTITYTVTLPDTTAPTVATTSTATNPTNSATIPLTITFNESVTGFDVSDITVTNATLSNFTGIGTTYTVDATPSSNGTITVDVDANTAIDTATNGNTAATQFSIVFDNVQPSVSITSSTTNPTSAASFPVTITFSESVTGFDISDITATNATLSSFSGSGTTYTVSVSSTLIGSGTISVNVAAAKATDTAGNNNTAASTFNINYIAPCSSSRIWIGSWIGGLPVANQPVVFLTDYTATSSLSACSLQINSPAIVRFPSGYNLTISGNMLVNSGGKLIMENNTNLIQSGTVNGNVGTGVTIKRDASMKYLDYVYWSSPVENQNLLAFSSATLSSRFYTIDEPTNAFVSAVPATNSFSLAKGYLIRAPNNWSSSPGIIQSFTGSFTGRPNNGTITIPVTLLGEGFNLIGNPYPSTVNADLFLADPDNQNIESLHFWTHLTTVAGGTNYATYNATGAAAPSNTIPVSETPNGFIQVGQGFIAKVTNAGNATFKNSMRAANNSNQFFKTADPEKKNRIWLNLSDATTAYNQTLVGYVKGATDALDTKYDARLMETSGTRLYSFINNSEYVIQGRSLPFTDTDIVSLGFKTTNKGTFTISIDHTDGLFADTEGIFLKDNLTNTVSNLKKGVYTFTSTEGTFNNRFEIVYKNDSTLGTETPSFTEESIVVYKQNNTLNINTGKTIIAAVKLFDMRGSLIYEKKDINSSTLSINSIDTTQQLLIVQVTSADNTTVFKKVIN
ncbi:MAG: Ig-like domain-containing protein [Bacteroidota bacterium]